MASYYMEKEEIYSYEADWSKDEDEYQGVIEDEDDYGRTTWYDECVSSSDCGEEPDGEELEPEPPDYYHSSQQHTKPHTYTDHTNWVQENSYFCEEDDDADYQYHPPRREEKSHSYGIASYRVQTQSTPAGPTKPTNKRCDYTSNPLIFTGFSKDPKVYLKWENNMKQWLRSNNIPKEEKLYYALSKLKGDAYEWWLKEDAATYYTTKAVLDWGTLKSRMYREFTKKYQPRIRTTKPLYMETPKKVVTTPKLQPIFQPMNAHSHEPRRASSSTRGTPIKAEQFVQVKEVQPDSAATLLHELQGKVNRGASHTMDKTVVLISQETTCCDLDSQAPHQSAITIQEDKTPTLKQETNSNPIGNQGTKDDNKGDTLKSKEFMDQNRNREEYTPLLIKRAANGDENFNETIQIKEKPPDENPLEPIQGKILHPHIIQWTNLTYLCVGDQVLRTKLLEEGGYDAVINPRTNHGEDYGRETTTQEQPSGNFNQVLPKTSGQSQFSLPEMTPQPFSVQTKAKIYSSCPEITWNTFSAQLPTTTKKNQPKRSSHEGIIQFSNQMMLSLPYLEADGESPSRIVLHAQAEVEEWINAMGPRHGVDTQNSRGSAGWIIRDHHGQPKAWGSSLLSHVSSPLEAESKALVVAMQQAWIRGYKKIMFEGDCEILIKAVTDSSQPSDIANLLLDIDFWASKFSAVVFTFVRRNNNAIAHFLASPPCEPQNEQSLLSTSWASRSAPNCLDNSKMSSLHDLLQELQEQLQIAILLDGFFFFIP
ncbi:Ribonuclease H domain [Arabidopsis suecica]|uniref:Ribonuclease H domain n=1 Tax=Arabidopsis suecica TaxID=45249 RepID=A0A8T2AIH0_ARASU|nr:Ribonuclease H domain [Arabidopsis suecica]